MLEKIAKKLEFFGFLLPFSMMGGLWWLMFEPNKSQSIEIDNYQKAMENIESIYGKNSYVQNVLFGTHYSIGICYKPRHAFQDAEKCQDLREKYVDPISSGDVQIAFSDKLPSLSVAQVFNDKVILAEHLPMSTHSLSLKLVLEYMHDRKSLGFDYGNGENFTITTGRITKYKNKETAHKILIPVS